MIATIYWVSVHPVIHSTVPYLIYSLQLYDVDVSITPSLQITNWKLERLSNQDHSTTKQQQQRLRPKPSELKSIQALKHHKMPSPPKTFIGRLRGIPIGNLHMRMQDRMLMSSHSWCDET